MIWSPFVLVAAAAAAKPKKRTATPGLVLVSFGDGPKYEGTLAYFRDHAKQLGFTSTLLWGLKDVERDPFFRANMTHLNRMGTRRPLCAGFKALMLKRALESAGEGGYVFWADASRYFDYASRPVKKGIARRAVERWLSLAPIDITYTNSSGRRLGLFRRNDGFEVDLGLMGDGCPPVPPSNGSVPLGY